MAIQLKSAASGIAAWVRSLGSTSAPTGSEGVLDAHLTDLNGLPLASLHGEVGNTNQYGLPSAGLNDGAVLLFRTDRLGNQASALHTPLVYDSFEGTTVHPGRWTITSLTMVAAQTTVGGLLFNSSSLTAVNLGYMIKSRPIMKSQRAPLQAKFRAMMNCVNNSVIEAGFIDATTFNGANTTGAYWQATSSGVIQPVLTFNGTDITGDDIRSLIDISKYYTYDIIMDDDDVVFTVQDSATNGLISRQSLKMPTTAPRLISATSISFGARLYNTAVSPATAPSLRLTDVYVLALDQSQMKPWPHVLATMDRNATVDPFTGTQLANWANSSEPASFTMSNSAAGSTALGGKFQFASLSGAATDYCLFAYLAPANLVVTGVEIETWNIGAAVATTPTLLTWAVASNNTAVTLASATGRIGLGVQSFAVGAPVGAKADAIRKQFQSPLSVAKGRYFHVIVRAPVSTNTASQIIAGMVNVEGYFE